MIAQSQYTSDQFKGNIYLAPVYADTENKTIGFWLKSIPQDCIVSEREVVVVSAGAICTIWNQLLHLHQFLRLQHVPGVTSPVFEDFWSMRADCVKVVDLGFSLLDAIVATMQERQQILVSDGLRQMRLFFKPAPKKG